MITVLRAFANLFDLVLVPQSTKDFLRWPVLKNPSFTRPYTIRLTLFLPSVFLKRSMTKLARAPLQFYEERNMVTDLIKSFLRRVGSRKEELNRFYVHSIPSNQNIVDIFSGDWSVAMPDEARCVSTPGHSKLFDDPRIHWAHQMLGGVEGANVLELGPLEGHHSYMLQKAGARSVTAIESNSRAFLKCLCVKEICNLTNVKFMLGDCVEYLKANTVRYDVVFANGVLYHMQNPMELLELLGQKTDKIVMWTHYYDANHIQSNPRLARKFDLPQIFQYKNFSYEAARQHYSRSLRWTGFCGGPMSTSLWLTRGAILGYLARMGFNDTKISFESADHPNGPSFNLCAIRA